MKIDLHVHAKERSPCSIAGEEAMIQAAIERGLDGLAFTDHHHLVPPQRIAELCTKYAPFSVFNGVEISTSEGEDLLVLGLYDLLLETHPWTSPELHTFVRQRGGFLLLAHPFRFRPWINLDLESHPPDGIEIHSTNIDSKNEDRIRALAKRLGLPLLCNSDAHLTADIGTYYNVLPRAPRDGRDLVRILKTNGHRCECRRTKNNRLDKL
jgi:histidinol phosphatase-like PHP family hydrolase